MKRAGLFVTALVLAGCAQPYSAYNDPYYDPGYYAPPPVQSTGGAETAQAVCSIDSLTTARNEMRTEVENVGGGYGYGGREQTRTQSRETVTERPWGPQTETVELLNTFAGDLDAAYRFATSSCQSYQMCMQNQGYTEAACMNSADQWRDARREFTSLSGRLAEIRLEITRTCDGCASPYGRYDGYGRYNDHPPPRHRPHYRGRDRDADCEGVLGDVFTTSACDYRDRRHRY
ncbi:hypothetical protein ACWCOP_00890 [Maricaulaceae bacterium MS644]